MNSPSHGKAPRLPSVVALLVVSHLVVDACTAFLPPLLPRIMDRLDLSIALASTLAGGLSLATSLPQPFFGYLVDRWGRRACLAAGPVVAGVTLSLLGLAPSYAALLALLLVGGLGAACFHPPAASLAAGPAGQRRSGRALSVFSFGGALGYAIGPVAAVGLVGWLGLKGLWVAMAPGLVLGVVLWRKIPDREPGAPQRRRPGLAEMIRALRGPLGIVFAISALAAFGQRAFLTFSPIISNESGVTEVRGAFVLSAYLGAQALGTLTGGVLTDRLNRRLVLIVAGIAAFPAHVLAIVLEPASGWTFVAATAAGFLNMVMTPPVVIMAQEMLPRATAVGSAVVMGLAWATGTLGLPLVGLAADQTGPVMASVLPMPAFLIAAALASRRSLRPYARSGRGRSRVSSKIT
ncbi:MAG: MFS transporter [Gemmatimonadetes bacterium]|nr:MFS transporter [Gemmatimonadota bacterium]